MENLGIVDKQNITDLNAERVRHNLNGKIQLDIVKLLRDSNFEYNDDFVFKFKDILVSKNYESVYEYVRFLLPFVKNAPFLDDEFILAFIDGVSFLSDKIDADFVYEIITSIPRDILKNDIHFLNVIDFMIFRTELDMSDEQYGKVSAVWNDIVFVAL